MPQYTILPTDPSNLSAEIIAPNAAGVLLMVQRLDYQEADVLCDGAYCFSARLDQNGLWCIFQRDDAGTIEVFG